MHILQLEKKIRYSMFTKSIRQKNPGIILDHEPELILTCETAFAKAFKKFSRKKNLNEFVKNQEYFIEPKQIYLGFDSTTQSEDTIQYVPIYSTWNTVLRHQVVLVHIYAETSPQCGVIKTFGDSLAFKSNKFLNSRERDSEICLYHDDFSVVNPLGNKTHKHKISAFCFVLGSLPPKFKSRLKDIHLVLLSRANFVSKYGYNSILSPLLKHLKTLKMREYK